MPFSERSGLKDERRPLLRDPVWHYNHRYNGRGYDPEEQGDLLGLDNPRSQKFHWIVFIGVTFISILILLATLGLLVKLSETHPPMGPKINTTTTQPINFDITTKITTTATTTTTSVPIALSSSVAPDQPTDASSPSPPLPSSEQPQPL
ncbi:unnamed protein product [Orchesella dallaii]|uniref:Uncharacterized protein n=1 Tax=Orchesella dallaii TaxID=48710 RepID=A0ABP1QYH6_9HEXA